MPFYIPISEMLEVSHHLLRPLCLQVWGCGEMTLNVVRELVNKSTTTSNVCCTVRCVQVCGSALQLGLHLHGKHRWVETLGETRSQDLVVSAQGSSSGFNQFLSQESIRTRGFCYSDLFCILPFLFLFFTFSFSWQSPIYFLSLPSCLLKRQDSLLRTWTLHF